MKKTISLLLSILFMMVLVPSVKVDAALVMFSDDAEITVTGLEYGKKTSKVKVSESLFLTGSDAEIEILDNEGNPIDSFSYEGQYILNIIFTGKNNRECFVNDGSGGYAGKVSVNGTNVDWALLMDESGEFTNENAPKLNVRTTIHIGNSKNKKISEVTFTESSDEFYIDGSDCDVFGEVAVAENSQYEMVAYAPYYKEAEDENPEESYVYVLLRAKKGYSFDNDCIINGEILEVGYDYGVQNIKGTESEVVEARILDNAMVLFNSSYFDGVTLKENDLLVKYKATYKKPEYYSEDISLNLSCGFLEYGRSIDDIEVTGYDTELMDISMKFGEYDDFFEEVVPCETLNPKRDNYLIVILSMKDSINHHFASNKVDEYTYQYTGEVSLGFDSLVSKNVGSFISENGFGVSMAEHYADSLCLVFKVTPTVHEYSLYYNEADGLLYTDAAFNTPYTFNKNGWSGNGKTLTLKNFTFETYLQYGLVMPENATLVCEENVYIGTTGTGGIALSGKNSSSLTISGNGNLSLSGSTALKGEKLNLNISSMNIYTDLKAIDSSDDINLDSCWLLISSSSVSPCISGKNLILKDSYCEIVNAGPNLSLSGKLKLKNSELDLSYYTDLFDYIGGVEMDMDSCLGKDSSTSVEVETESDKEFTIGNAKNIEWHILNLNLSLMDSDADSSNGYDKISVTVDDKKLNEGSDYTLESGSVKILLNKKFLNSLKVGKHKVELNLDRYTITTSIKVKEEITEEKEETAAGTVTCEEAYGKGWTWDNEKQVCSLGYKVVNTSVR